jgi:hypothetical protein
MTTKMFICRCLLLACIGLVLTVRSDIAMSWWLGSLAGMGLAAVFTIISEVVLQGPLWGKIGRTLPAKYKVHLIYETVIAVFLVVLVGLATGLHASHCIFLAIGLVCGWLVLCFEAIGSIAVLEHVDDY